jgi:hypothetical protein
MRLKKKKNFPDSFFSELVSLARDRRQKKENRAISMISSFLPLD